MPRFFIDTSDQHEFVRDEDGTEFDDVEAARHAAIDVLPDMARDQLPDGDQRLFLALVRDDQGRAVLHATLALNVTWLTDAFNKHTVSGQIGGAARKDLQEGSDGPSEAGERRQD